MIFFLVLILATAVAALALRGRGLRTIARWGLGIAMVVAGLSHLASPTPFEQHLPDWVPWAGALIAVTGLVEIALGTGLAFGHSRQRQIGMLTAAYLVAVFPANVYVALAGVEVDGQPGGIYPWLRLPFQALFIAWALWSTGQPSRRHQGPPRGGLIPPLPWTPGPHGERSSDGPATTMASRLVLRRFRDVPAFLGAAMRLRALFHRSPGALRLSLQAAPLARTFWTLSAWESQEALEAFAGQPAHVDIMRRFGPNIATSTFVTWVTATPTWPEAYERIAASDQPRPRSASHTAEGVVASRTSG